MKVLAINGSARKNGNTSLLLQTVLDEVRKQNIDTETVCLCDLEIAPCKGCFACLEKHICMIPDDFQAVFEKMVHADGILLGAPVYSADIPSRMKAFLERAGVIVSGSPELLRCKAGASVAAVRRGGGMTAVDTMNHFFLNKQMFVVGSTYWNMVYGKEPGDVLSDGEGIRNMKNLGQNLAWLLKCLHEDIRKVTP